MPLTPPSVIETILMHPITSTVEIAPVSSIGHPSDNSVLSGKDGHGCTKKLN